MSQRITLYGLALPFDTDDPEFTRGVEVGTMWAQLQHPCRGPFEEFTIHDTNVEMAMRISEALHMPIVETIDLDANFIQITFGESSLIS